jgi:hypothetical protein
MTANIPHRVALPAEEYFFGEWNSSPARLLIHLRMTKGCDKRSGVALVTPRFTRGEGFTFDCREVAHGCNEGTTGSECRPHAVGKPQRLLLPGESSSVVSVSVQRSS